MINCRKIILILGWLCLFPVLISGQGKISSLSVSMDTLHVFLEFQKPELTGSYSNRSRDTRQSVLPGLSETLVILSNTTEIEVTIRKLLEEKMDTESPVLPVADIAIGDEGDISYYKEHPLPEVQWDFKTLTSFKGTTVSLLRVYPWRLGNSEKQIRWIQNVIFQFVGEGVRLAPGNTIPAGILSEMVMRRNKLSSAKNRLLLQDSAEKASQSLFPSLKIEVSSEGIMHVSQEMIGEAGWDVERVNPHFLRVVGEEGEIPVRVTGESDGSFDPGDFVEFWVEPLWDRSESGEIRLDVFALKNVYWLEIGNSAGLRLAQEEGVLPGSQYETITFPRSFPFSVHFEEDNSFHRLPYAYETDQGDYWFYASPITGGVQRSFPFSVHDPDNFAPQHVIVRVKLRGQSTSSISHPFALYVNDMHIGSGEWWGNKAILMNEMTISSAYLSKKNNELVVVNQSPEGVLSQLMLDWFEVIYPRFYLVHDNYLRFRAPQYSLGKVCRFQIEGFTRGKIEVYKKGASRIVGHQIETIEDSTGTITYRVRFEDLVVNEDTEYVVLSLSKKMTPNVLKPVYDTNLRSSSKGASYVMIVASDSLRNESLGELIVQRQSQGMQVEVVTLQSIYNEFNRGIPNPAAIRQFLKYAYNFWTPSPRSVLLVGDGYTNCRVGAEKGNMIPVVLYQTVKYGAAPSDHWYTLLEGEDAIPEIAIGRLPVRNQTELSYVVDKILQNERSPPEPWKNRYLLIGAGGSGDVFRQQSENLIHQIFDPSIHPERLYLSGDLSDPYVGGTEDLMRHFREGVFHVNFRGHGGGAIWSDAGLLDLDDVGLIENRNKLPFITSMTCFTCDFSSSRIALGEALILEKDVGGVAFWGSTGLGWLWNDYYLLQEFYRVLNANPALPIGEMLRRAKTAYLMTYGGDLPVSEAHQFTLLGDPAMRLSLPAVKTPITLHQYALNSMDTLVVAGSVESDNYNCFLEVNDPEYTAQHNYEEQFQQSPWQMKLPVPSDFSGSGGSVRAYIWDSETGYQARGYVPFTVGGTFFDSLKTIPEQPGYQDSIFFSVMCEDPLGIQSIHCIVSNPLTDTLEMTLTATQRVYVTVEGIGSLNPGTRLSYAFRVINDQGGISQSDPVTYLLPSLPDLTVKKCHLQGRDKTVLKAWIQNRGGEQISTAQVRFECLQLGIDEEVQARFFDKDTALVQIPVLPLMGHMDFVITVNPDSSIIESRYENNLFNKTISVNRFNVTPEEGSWHGSAPSDTVGLPEKLLCFIPPEAISEKTTILFEELTNNSGSCSQMGLGPGDHIYSISLPGLAGESELMREAMLLFKEIHTDSTQEMEPYWWNSANQRWIFYPNVRSESGITIYSNNLGFFRLMHSDDNDPPHIELQVNNQPFADGSYTSRNPMFMVLFQDQSGVDIQNGKIGFYLDDELQDPATLIMPDSTMDPTQIAVTFRPQLMPGQHTLYMTASDVNGNTGQSETYSFHVATQLEIQYLGNHPNPFKWETVFVYVLTESVERFILKVYTVSGRLIRTFDDYDFASADYHEIVWDGRDEWGNEVANGVYFFRITAEGIQGKKEVTGKIAKIR